MFSSLMQHIVLPCLSFAVVLGFIRLAKGPSLADRVIAFDLLATLGIGILAAYAVVTEQPALLDVGLVLALVSFLGTVAFAHYMERLQQ